VLPAPGKVAKPEHHAALPYAELPAFMATLTGCEGVAARALEFTILTAARTGETVGAKWHAISLREKLWTIPAGRMKASKEHRVPLSDRAVALLRALPTEGDFVFVGQRPGTHIGDLAMFRALKRLRDVSIHGFRSTFSDWAHECTAHSSHTIELSLAHSVGNQVEKAYRRGDMFEKRRKLMEAWARFATSRPAAGEVVPLRGRAR